MGIGSSSDRKQPEPIEAGSAVSAVLVRGDMDIAATCTVTYVDPQRLLACGHPLLQFGEVDLPMTKATVLATLPSPMNAFKIVNTTETIGAFVQDRQTGIMGVTGQRVEDDSRDRRDAQRVGDQGIPLRNSQQRETEPACHDGDGVQRAAWHQRIRRRYYIPHEWRAEREGLSRRDAAQHVCSAR